MFPSSDIFLIEASRLNHNGKSSDSEIKKYYLRKYFPSSGEKIKKRKDTESCFPYFWAGFYQFVFPVSRNLRKQKFEFQFKKKKKTNKTKNKKQSQVDLHNAFFIPVLILNTEERICQESQRFRETNTSKRFPVEIFSF